MSELVSAVMVTGKTMDRLPLIKSSISSFANQTYENKQLVIVTDLDELRAELAGYLINTKFEKEFAAAVYRAEPTSLGGLRNVGLVKAAGSWIIQWDDDDWSSPERIAVQMQHAKPDHAVVLNWQVRYSFINNAAFELPWFGKVPGIPGTILYPKRKSTRYRLEPKHEDSHLIVDHFTDRLVVVDNSPRAEHGPELFFRLYHGRENTWDHAHVMREYATKPDVWDLSERSRTQLVSLLNNEYKEMME